MISSLSPGESDDEATCVPVLICAPVRNWGSPRARPDCAKYAPYGSPLELALDEDDVVIIPTSRSNTCSAMVLLFNCFKKEEKK